jgi:hypothetical protein
MPTVNGPDEITTLRGSADKVFYTDSNGDVQEVSIGTDGQTLVSTGATAPEFDGLTGLKGGPNKVLYTNPTGHLQELGLSATAGDVLTSNGAAVSPTWVAPSSGGLTLTSAESITAGMAIAIDSTGNAEIAQDTTVAPTTSTTPFSYSAYNPTYSSTNSSSCQYYDTATGVHVKFAMKADFAAGPVYYKGMRGIGFTLNSGANTYTQGTELQTTTWDGYGQYAGWHQGAVYDTTGEVGLLYAEAETTQYLGVVAVAASGTGTGNTLTMGTRNQFTSTATYSPFAIYVPDLGYSIIAYGNASGLCVRTITPAGSGSTTSPTVGVEVVLDATSIATTSDLSMAYDDTNNIITMVWKASSEVWYLCGSVAGGSITWGTKASIAPNNIDKPSSICYRSADSRWMILYPLGSNYYQTHTGTWTSGTTISWTTFTATALLPVGGLSDTYWPIMNHVDDGLSYITVVAADNSLTNNAYILMFYLDPADNNYKQNVAAGISAKIMEGMGYTQGGVTYDSISGRHLVTGRRANYDVFYGVSKAYSGEDKTGFAVGIAQSSVGAAASIDIKTLGQVDDNQTGLTIGDRVYVQTNGTLGSTTASGTALGVATAADSLLITNTGSFTK